MSFIIIIMTSERRARKTKRRITKGQDEGKAMETAGQGNRGAYTAHTAPGVTFETWEELMEHYKSEWHKYNLKRKAAGLPLVSKELFEKIKSQVNEAASQSNVTKEDHLKQTDGASKRRLKKAAQQEAAQRRREQMEEEEEEEGGMSDSCSLSSEEWEEVSGEEAVEALKALEQREQDDLERQAQERIQRGSLAHRPSPSFPSILETRQGKECLFVLTCLAGEGPLRLASKGQELVVANSEGESKLIGNRSLAHLYRQRHRRQDNRVSVAKASSNHNKLDFRSRRPPEHAISEQHSSRSHSAKTDVAKSMERSNKRRNLPSNVPY